MKPKRPTPKSFDISKYKETIDSLHVNMSELEFERLSEVVVPDILENYEAFEKVVKGPDFRGTPFDFFGFKADRPYMIEYKGSLKSFNTPGETQKRRLQEILERMEGLSDMRRGSDQAKSSIFLTISLKKSDMRYEKEKGEGRRGEGGRTKLSPQYS